MESLPPLTPPRQVSRSRHRVPLATGSVEIELEFEFQLASGLAFDSEFEWNYN